MRSRKGPKIDPHDVVKAGIAALPAKSVGDARDVIAVDVDFRRPTYGMVIEAAKARRLSVPAYIRRAVYAFAAHDLEIPLQDALDRDPRVTRDTGYSLQDPTGTLFGHWEIARLVGEEVPDEPVA
jgi:hypothetical protein